MQANYATKLVGLAQNLNKIKHAKRSYESKRKVITNK